MPTLPSVFISHGGPNLVLEEGPTQDFFRSLPERLGNLRGIVCISAHWMTGQPAVSGAVEPETIYDFYGFPPAMYRLRYPAPGAPHLAGRVVDLLSEAGLSCSVDENQGLDHGAWVPLFVMLPQADIPVLQLSVQPHQSSEHHVALGRALRPLKDDGILILGSGSATHNLRDIRRELCDGQPLEYVREFDLWLQDAVLRGDESALTGYLAQGPAAQRNHPTPEHFLPLLVALGAGDGNPRLLHEGYSYGAISMTAFAWD